MAPIGILRTDAFAEIQYKRFTTNPVKQALSSAIDTPAECYLPSQCHFLSCLYLRICRGRVLESESGSVRVETLSLFFVLFSPSHCPRPQTEDIMCVTASSPPHSKATTVANRDTKQW